MSTLRAWWVERRELASATSAGGMETYNSCDVDLGSVEGYDPDAEDLMHADVQEHGMLVEGCQN